MLVVLCMVLERCNVPNHPPEVPLFTGQLDIDAQLLVFYLYTLRSYLQEGEPTGQWTTSGNTFRSTLVVGDTLTDTQHTLGTLINVLVDKGIL